MQPSHSSDEPKWDEDDIELMIVFYLNDEGETACDVDYEEAEIAGKLPAMAAALRTIADHLDPRGIPEGATIQ